MNANTADASADPITLALQRAHRAFNAGRINVVERECRHVLEREPENAEAWVLMSTVARHHQRLPEAVEMLRRAVTLKPDNDYMQEALAEVYLEGRDFRNATPLYHRLSARRPDAALALGLAKCLWGTGRHDKALELFTEATRKPDATSATQISLAQAYVSLARFDAAHDLLTTVLKQYPLHAPAWMLLALLEFDDRQPQRAIELMDHACKFADAPARCHQLHAALLTLAGRADAARDARRRVPETHEARAGWQWLDFACGPAKEARIMGFDEKVLLHALEPADVSGATLEFGVFHGRTLRLIADRIKRDVHGFDTTREASADERSSGLPGHVTLHAGPLRDILPEFFSNRRKALRFVHLNERSYDSTRFMLDAIGPHLRPGSVLVFGEFMAYPGFEEAQFKAFHDWAGKTNARYRYLALGLLSKSGAVALTD